MPSRPRRSSGWPTRWRDRRSWRRRAPHFRQAAELDANYRDGLLELADLYEKDKQPAEAIAIYREFPENAAAQGRLGELLLETKEYTGAIPHLEEAYTKEPTQETAWRWRWPTYSTNRSDKALPLLEQAVAAEPSNYDVRMMYAAPSATKGSSRRRPPVFGGCRLKPGEANTWSDLGDVLYMMEDYPQSLAASTRRGHWARTLPANWFLRANSS